MIQRSAPAQPVIHRNISDMTTVLNRFVYQKAGWVLHMLRAAMGTEKFWTGIRDYYRRYRDLNASTDDFRQVMEQASETDLSWFFDQWLRRPGVPKLKGTWHYDPATRQLHVELAQAQAGSAFRLPIEVGIAGPKGPLRIERIQLSQATGQFTISTDVEPSSVVLDPNTWVLMEPPEFVKR